MPSPTTAAVIATAPAVTAVVGIFFALLFPGAGRLCTSSRCAGAASATHEVCAFARLFFFFFNRCSLYSAGLYGGVDYTDSGGFGRGTGGMPRRPSSNCTGAKSANCTGEK